MLSSEIWQNLKTLVRGGLMVRTHSGQVQPGDVFVALPGTRTDGSAYIADAVARKAAWVIAGPGQEPELEGPCRVVRHPDPRAALGELAAAHFGTEQACPLLVGVTGTNGKTTTVHLLEHLLGSSGLRVGVIGTIGASWPGGTFVSGMTTPDCWTLHEILARMHRAGVTHVCMEVSSHALEQKRTAGLRFEVAVLTNVTQDHLDYHRDMETYFQAKARLFASNDKESTAPRWRVINEDDPYGRRLLSQWGGLGYGLYAEGHDRMQEEAVEHVPHGILHQSGTEPRRRLHGTIQSCDQKGLQLRMNFDGRGWDLHSGLVGRYNASNLLAAQGVGLCLGLVPEQLTTLAHFSGVPGRLERVMNNLDLDIFVDYAHTPDALENVLGALRELHFDRLIVVFGCGGNRDRSKRPLMGKVVARLANVAVLTSDNPRHEDPKVILDDVQAGLAGMTAVIREEDRKRALEKALELMRPGDVLLVAGKGHESTQQIRDDFLPFHDPTVIRQILEDGRGCASKEPVRGRHEVLPCA